MNDQERSQRERAMFGRVLHKEEQHVNKTQIEKTADLVAGAARSAIIGFLEGLSQEAMETPSAPQPQQVASPAPAPVAEKRKPGRPRKGTDLSSFNIQDDEYAGMTAAAAARKFMGDHGEHPPTLIRDALEKGGVKAKTKASLLASVHGAIRSRKAAPASTKKAAAKNAAIAPMDDELKKAVDKHGSEFNILPGRFAGMAPKTAYEEFTAINGDDVPLFKIRNALLAGGVGKAKPVDPKRLMRMLYEITDAGEEEEAVEETPAVEEEVIDVTNDDYKGVEAGEAYDLYLFSYDGDQETGISKIARILRQGGAQGGIADIVEAIIEKNAEFEIEHSGLNAVDAWNLFASSENVDIKNNVKLIAFAKKHGWSGKPSELISVAKEAREKGDA